MNAAIIGGPEGRQRMVVPGRVDGRWYWYVTERVKDDWETVSGGFVRKTDAVNEARRLMEATP